MGSAVCRTAQSLSYAGGDAASLTREQSRPPLPAPRLSPEKPVGVGGSGDWPSAGQSWGTGPRSRWGEGSSPGRDSAIWAGQRGKGAPPERPAAMAPRGATGASPPPAIGAQRRGARTPHQQEWSIPALSRPPALLVRAGRTGAAACGRPDRGQTGAEAARSHRRGGGGAGIEARPRDVGAPQPSSKAGCSSSRPRRESPAWRVT